MYSLLKPLLFSLDPETSHNFALSSMSAAKKAGVLSLIAPEVPDDKVEVMGITFPNRIGLAAGLDKNGEHIDALGSLGFGFIEIGTITPVAQPGNPKPRLFRLKNEQAIINRMGFNNKGVNFLVEQVKNKQYKGVLGINIGKNKSTPDEAALFDYERCLEAVYPYADYITVNVSSPNTPGLRALQFGEVFNDLLQGIKVRQAKLHAETGRYVPIAVKIAPDMEEDEFKEVADCLVSNNIDAVIATNTTVSRVGVENSPFKEEMGGLSGLPVREKSTQAIRVLSEHLKGAMPIIGVGGIQSGKDALEKVQAGASLVQVYSGFIYRGPELIKEAASALIK